MGSTAIRIGLFVTLVIAGMFLLGFIASPQPAHAQNGTCTDTDEGTNKAKAGVCIGKFGNVWADECIDENRIAEYFCTADALCQALGDTSCPVGTTCSDGECIVSGGGTTGGTGGGPGGGLVPDCGDQGNPCTFAHFFELISNVIDFVIRALAPILVILLMAIGGFYMMISHGNPTQFKRGKDMIVWALIGYTLILTAWIIVDTLLTSIGVVSGLDITNWYIINF